MAVIQDLTVPTSSDFLALTNALTPKRLVDSVFVGSPTLDYFRRNMIMGEGAGWSPLIQYGANASGGWYDEGDQLTVTNVSGQIATRAIYTYKYLYKMILLNAQSTDLQGSATKLIDLMDAQVRNCLMSMQDDLNQKIFDGNPSANPAQMDSLNTIIDNISAAVGGLNCTTGGYEKWAAHMMVGEDTYATPVAPSLQNIRKMIRTIITTCGANARPDLCIVSPDLWDVLAAQVDETTWQSSQRRTYDPVVQWGFETFFINGVPVVEDRDMYGAAWVPAQSTRTNAAGYQAMFVNFDHIKMINCAKRSFKWDPAGWVRPQDYDRYLNKLYFWGTIGCDARRPQGRIMNMCIDQENLAQSDWKLGKVTLPQA